MHPEMPRVQPSLHRERAFCRRAWNRVMGPMILRWWRGRNRTFKPSICWKMNGFNDSRNSQPVFDTFFVTGRYDRMIFDYTAGELVEVATAEAASGTEKKK